ncbi:hypothetical protein BH24ACT15_BH24ACT15_29880 [soil metagenome]
MTKDPDPEPVIWHVTSVRLTPEEHAALKRIATENQRSVSGEIRYLIACRVEEGA